MTTPGAANTGPANTGPASTGQANDRRGRERAALAEAIALSRASLGVSTPNPPVGAVVLDADGSVVGRGTTEAPGGRHAEVVALDEAGTRARHGTIVVTLEPCDHQGRTGPCTARILSAGIARVVYGAADLKAGAVGSLYNLSCDPRLNHEFPVESGVRADECAALLTEFFAALRM